MSENDPAQERLDQQSRTNERNARNRSSVDLLRLASGASQATGALLQIPTSISGAIKNLSTDAANVVGFFESQTELLRGMGEFGVTFNNDVSRFIRDVARARVSQQQLAGIVQNQTEGLLTLGVSAQDGLNRFLRAQTQFREQMQIQVQDLKQLGFTTAEINETFLEFDRIQRMGRIRTFANDRERNLAATEFAETLDRLTFLTGKRREQLQQEISAVSREGDVQARTTQLGQSGADSLRNTVAVMGGFGEGIQNLTRDILTRGYALDARMAGIAGPLTDSLYELRRAQETGNAELIAQKEAEVRHAAAALRQDRRIIELAIHKGRNEYGNLAASILEDSADGMAQAIQQGREVVGQRLGKSAAEVTTEELQAYFEQMYDQNLAARLARAADPDDPNAGPNAGQQLFAGMQQALTMMEDSQAQIVDAGVTRIFDAAGAPLQRFTRYLDGIIDNDTISNSVNEVVGMFERAIDEIAPGTGSANNAARNAYASGDAGLARAIAEIRTLRDAATDPGERARLQERLDELVNSAPSTLEVAAAYITSQNGSIEARAASINIGPELDALIRREQSQSGAGSSNSIGTLGSIGRYFKDYGVESNIAVHGMQAVMTPRQAAEFGASIASGAASKIAGVISDNALSSNRSVVGSFDTAFNSSMQNMTGKLNTIRNDAARALTNNESIDLEELERRLTGAFASVNRTDIGKEIRDAFAPVSELISISREQLNVGQRQLKGIRGMSGDVLRGA